MASAVDSASQSSSASTPPAKHELSRVDSMSAQQARPASGDFLACQWTNCGEICPSAEVLYEHVCDRHIGRKSTNNLTLTCEWGTCRTATVKRDHITSHMRVHVPLKPHKCDFCGKQFKRPQDLKKHVKTHAEDSVMRSPDANGQSGGQFGADSKSFYNGQDLGSSYGHSGSHHDHNGNGYNSFGNGYSSYGRVNYPGSSLADQHSLDTRRRALEALNDFLGDVKRRAVDPGHYYDVGARLNTQSLPLPISTGAGYSLNGTYGSNQNSHGHNQSFSQMLDSFAGSGNNMSYNTNSGGVHAPMSQAHAPVNYARTKDDLLDIDRFLEQLQATVYENSGQAAAAGIQQPGVHAHMPSGPSAYNWTRSSHSPPHSKSLSGSMAQPLASVAQLASSHTETPALTPSSMSSYTSSGHSPISNHSRSSGDGLAMYPQLPSVASLSEFGSSFAAAPASGLASSFDNSEHRRYSGGRLQRQAPAPKVEVMDVDEDGQATPKRLSLSESDAKKLDDKLKEEQSEADQAESGMATPTRAESAKPEILADPESPEESAEDKAQEAWVENVRVIEQLRNWVKDRLEQGDFDSSEKSTPEPESTKGLIERPKSPVDEAMEDAPAPEPIAYPTLKSVE